MTTTARSKEAAGKVTLGIRPGHVNISNDNLIQSLAMTGHYHASYSIDY
jgi:hypothetical protein